MHTKNVKSPPNHLAGCQENPALNQQSHQNSLHMVLTCKESQGKPIIVKKENQHYSTGFKACPLYSKDLDPIHINPVCTTTFTLFLSKIR